MVMMKRVMAKHTWLVVEIIHQLISRRNMFTGSAIAELAGLSTPKAPDCWETAI
jgi:hypothetical protein